MATTCTESDGYASTNGTATATNDATAVSPNASTTDVGAKGEVSFFDR